MTKQILRLAPLAQSLAIANANFKNTKKKKLKVEDVVGAGIKTIIGAEFIKAESNLIEGM